MCTAQRTSAPHVVSLVIRAASFVLRLAHASPATSVTSAGRLCNNSHAVGPTTSSVPSTVIASRRRCQSHKSKPIPNTTCDSATTETRAGGPTANALVRKSWPTVAETPTANNISSTRKSNSPNEYDSGGGRITSAARQNASDTPEK